MTQLRWVDGVSPLNDRCFTFGVLHQAIAACRNSDLLDVVARVALALDAVQALHPDARQWDETQGAERVWFAAQRMVTAMPPRSAQQRVRVEMLHALGALARRLIDSLDGLDALIDAQQVFDSMEV